MREGRRLFRPRPGSLPALRYPNAPRRPKATPTCCQCDPSPPMTPEDFLASINALGVQQLPARSELNVETATSNATAARSHPFAWHCPPLCVGNRTGPRANPGRPYKRQWLWTSMAAAPFPLPFDSVSASSLARCVAWGIVSEPCCRIAMRAALQRVRQRGTEPPGYGTVRWSSKHKPKTSRRCLPDQWADEALEGVNTRSRPTPPPAGAVQQRQRHLCPSVFSHRLHRPPQLRPPPPLWPSFLPQPRCEGAKGAWGQGRQPRATSAISDLERRSLECAL